RRGRPHRGKRRRPRRGGRRRSRRRHGRRGRPTRVARRRGDGGHGGSVHVEGGGGGHRDPGSPEAGGEDVLAPWWVPEEEQGTGVVAGAGAVVGHLGLAQEDLHLHAGQGLVHYLAGRGVDGRALVPHLDPALVHGHGLAADGHARDHRGPVGR